MLLLALHSWADVATIAGATLALLAATVGYVRWVRPRLRRIHADVVGTRDAILGRDAIRDSITGREIEPALPGIGQRMATVEEAIIRLAQTDDTVGELRADVTDLQRRVSKLEDIRTERIITQAESAQQWRAVTAAHEARNEVDDADDDAED